jgi:hypothetical protein
VADAGRVRRRAAAREGLAAQSWEREFDQARAAYERAYVLRQGGDRVSGLLWLARSLEQLDGLRRKLDSAGDQHLAANVASLYRSAEMSIAADAANSCAILMRLPHAGAVTCVAYSPDPIILRLMRIRAPFDELIVNQALPCFPSDYVRRVGTRFRRCGIRDCPNRLNK